MPRVLPVRVIALRRDPDWTISRLKEQADISMSAARRYWYGTQAGTKGGEEMFIVDLKVLDRIAKALGVSAHELIDIERAARPAAKRQQPTAGRAEVETSPMFPHMTASKGLYQ